MFLDDYTSRFNLASHIFEPVAMGQPENCTFYDIFWPFTTK